MYIHNHFLISLLYLTVVLISNNKEVYISEARIYYIQDLRMHAFQTWYASISSSDWFDLSISLILLHDVLHRCRGEEILLAKDIGQANKAYQYGHNDPVRRRGAFFQEGRRQEQKHCHSNGSKGQAPQKAHCRGYDCQWKETGQFTFLKWYVSALSP